MAVDPDSVIEGFNIFKNKSVGMFEVNNVKSVKLFSFD